MKNRGFTLVELLAVVTIFAIICVLAIPPILNQVNNNKSAVSNANLEIIYRASDLYINEVKASSTYCITLQELVDKDLLASPVKDMNTGSALDLNRKVKVVTDINKKATYSLLASGTACTPTA